MQRYKVKSICLVLELVLAGSAFCGEQGIMLGMTFAHNAVRAEVGLPELAWSDELAGFAQEWADSLAQKNGCAIEHRPRDYKSAQGLGENIYWASPVRLSNGTSDQQDITPERVVQRWAMEKANYSYAANSCRTGKECGHYTQIIWQQTTGVGCGRAVCADKSQVWVCNYHPAGNQTGEKPY